MNYSEFNLGQLLELALRVPEVGAVNFNILYYILKTIIEKEGLAELKPIVNLDSFLTDPESSLKGSFSDKDIVGAKDKLKERYDEYDEKSRNTKGSLKWKNIQLFKRLDSIEEEIDTIHQGLSQLFNEMSNLERVSRHQAEKVVKVISEVPQLMEMRKEISELKLKYEEIADSSFFEEKSDKTSEVPLSETRISENKLDMEKVKENILTESKTKEDLRSKISDLTCESEIPEEVVKHKVTEKEVRKPSHRKSKEQEILSKIELLNEEVISIKEMMKFGLLSHTAARTDDQEKDETVMEERVIDLEDIPSKQGKIIKKMDLHLLDVSTELHKLMDKCDVLDRTFSQEIGQIKESTLILEHTSTKYVEEIETLKVSIDEIGLSLEGMKDDLTYMETQVTALTELPGLKNRIERLEEYIYSGSEYRHVDTTDVRKLTAEEAKRANLKVFKPITEEGMEDETEKDHDTKHLRSVAQGVLLVQDLDKETKRKALRFPTDLYRTSVIDDIYLYEKSFEDEQEPEVPEDFQSNDFAEMKKVSSDTKLAQKDSEEIVKSTTFASHDLLEELKKKVVLYVKKRLHDFEIELQNLERNITLVKKQTDYLEKYSKELGEKISFMDANFSQRAGDLAALKNSSECHQASIVSIMHHLERKAEAYTVNQKVNRRELAIIEDRVLKLCKTTTSDITKLDSFLPNQKSDHYNFTASHFIRDFPLNETLIFKIHLLEEKMDDAFGKFSSELDKKLFIEEFKIHLDFLKHKLKVCDIKFKELSIEPAVIDFESFRPPVEIRKYVVCKDGTKIKQARRTITTGEIKSSPDDNLIPLLCHLHEDREVSPKTSAQVQKQLELSSSRESKRYVEGAYTKIKVGRK